MQTTIDLNKVSVANFIQLIGMSGLTGKILFSGDASSKEAFVAFDKGVMVHAQIDSKDGHDALNEVLLKRTGNASFIESDLTGVPTSLVAKNSEINLPDWVLSRLRQDNANVSQAITDLVIWADRLKCWIYQADSDLEHILGCLQEEQRK